MEDAETNVHSSVTRAPGADPLLGLLFESRYSIHQVLGSGATSTVYKAHDSLLDREVVIKIMHSHLLSNDEVVQRFKNEFATCVKLVHPNICRVYNYGISADNRPFMVIDYLDGASLSEVLSKQTKPDPQDLFSLFLQIIDALSYAHDQGVIHRDIKPNNIIITDSGQKAVLTDFGLAKWIDLNNSQGTTQTGAILGSSAYMSPEQCLGKKDIDCRSDIYSLACVMLEAICGKSPFQGLSAFDAMYRHLNQSFGKLGYLKELPPSFSKVIEKCLQKDRDKRYQSMSELKIDFYKCSESAKHWFKTDSSKRQASFLGLFLLLLLVGSMLVIPKFNISISPEKSKNPPAAYNINKTGSAKKNQRLYKGRVPSNIDDLKGLLQDEVKARGSEAAFPLLDRWMTTYGTEPTLEKDRIGIWGLYVKFHSDLNQLDLAESYMKRVLKSEFASSCMYEALLPISSMYERLGQYQKGLELIKRVMNEYPCQADWKVQVVIVKANCLMGLSKYNEAQDELEKVNKEIIADQGLRMYEKDLRCNLITLQLINHRTADTSKIIKQCEGAARNEEFNKSVGIKNAPGDMYVGLANAFNSGGDLINYENYLKMARNEYLHDGNQQKADATSTILAALYRERKDYAAALAIEREILKHKSNLVEKANLLEAMAQEAYNLKDFDACDKYGREEAECCQKLLDQESSDLNSPADLHYVNAVNRLRNSRLNMNDIAGAQKVVDEWIKKIDSKFGSNNLIVFLLYRSKSDLLSWINKQEESLQTLEQAYSIISMPGVQEKLKAHSVDINEQLGDLYSQKARILAKTKEYALANQNLQKAISHYQQKTLFSVDQIIESNLVLAANLDVMGKQHDAETCYDSIVPLWRRANFDWSMGHAGQLKSVADFKLRAGKFTEAEKLYRECIAGLIKRYPQKMEEMYLYYCGLAQSLSGQKKYSEAIRALHESEKLVLKGRGMPYSQTEYLLANCYGKQKNFPEAVRHIKNFLAVCAPHETADGYNKLAQFYSDSNMPQQQIETYQDGLKKLGKNLSASESLVKTHEPGKR